MEEPEILIRKRLAVLKLDYKARSKQLVDVLNAARELEQAVAQLAKREARHLGVPSIDPGVGLDPWWRDTLFAAERLRGVIAKIVKPKK